MFKKVVHIFTEYKIIRGMLSYAVLWPVGSLIEQTMVEKRNWQTYDWKKCVRCDYVRDVVKMDFFSHLPCVLLLPPVQFGYMHLCFLLGAFD